MDATLEPCPLSVSAMLHARVAYTTTSPKTGALGGAHDLFDIKYNHTLEITQGVLADESSKLQRRFFRERR